MGLSEQNLNPDIFEGAAMHENFPNGRGTGTIRVSGNGVFFQSEHGEVLLPLKDLKINLGGASDRLIFFAHPSAPDWSVYTSDKSILKHQTLLNLDALKGQIMKVQKKRLFGVAVLGTVLLVLFGLIFGVYLLKDTMTRSIAKQIPIEWEQKLGDVTFESIMADSTVIEDPEINSQLKIITDRLMQGVYDKRYAFKFHIVSNPEPNAFALPGGNVVIYSGLIFQADDPEEVAGVLAHEIAHVTEQHGLRNILSSLGLLTIVQAFLGDISELSTVILDAGTYLAYQKFSRDFEREADDNAWAYMTKSNLNPRGLITFFKKIRDLKKDKPEEAFEKSLNVLSTHPPTDERIQSLEKKWEQSINKKFDKINIDFKEFQTKIRNNLTK